MSQQECVVGKAVDGGQRSSGAAQRSLGESCWIHILTLFSSRSLALMVTSEILAWSLGLLTSSPPPLRSLDHLGSSVPHYLPSEWLFFGIGYGWGPAKGECARPVCSVLADSRLRGRMGSAEQHVQAPGGLRSQLDALDLVVASGELPAPVGSLCTLVVASARVQRIRVWVRLAPELELEVFWSEHNNQRSLNFVLMLTLAVWN